MMGSHRFIIALFITLLIGSLAQTANARQAPDSGDEARERKVMERFLSVLEKTPRLGTALDRVYGYHVEQGTIDAFVKNYQAKVAANSRDGTSWLILGLIEAQRGRDATAVEAFRSAEASRPDDALPAYYLGQALVLVGQPDAAAEAFERALTRKPNRADLLDIYQALGRVHQRAHRNDKALAVWDRLEKAFPDDPRVQDQIAHALAEEGQDAAALVRFEALARSTKDKFRQIQFAIEAAELKVSLGKGSEALSDFESLLARLDPESWLGREVRHKVEDVFLRTDDLAGLTTYYERWIQKNPDDVEAMARLGRVLAGQARLPEARKWLEDAVRKAPTRRELRLALIEQLVIDKQFSEASTQYEALAKLEPNNPDVFRDWGRLLLRDLSRPEADRKQAAAAIWRKLAPENAKDAVLVAQVADLLRQAGLTDEAIVTYEKAIALAPDPTQYREYLGEYYHTLKRPTDAIRTWMSSADNRPRNARALGRLGEVLAGFGYRRESIEPLTEACRLEPDDFDLRMKLADVKLALEKPIDALIDLELAEKLASADEQVDAVQERLIQAYQASGTLASAIDSLRKSLATKPSATGWTRLARLFEASQKTTDAAQAIEQATRLDPKSTPAWVASARLREASGDILGAAEALRTLARLDRRSRTDYLTGIAKLEARLGRKAAALEAGRELLAAAPGNPEHHQFFAELCFQLGETEEGLNALRRASRANPSDAKAMMTLAENLARQFRSDEAIELYWRAFARTPELDAKLLIVARMTEQYLQRNQLDRLLARLERELREPNQQRELALCLAQAHSTGGDYASARGELERLLGSNARDASLLLQLSSLAEQEGDPAVAAGYQKQALAIVPNAEGNARLAQLYLEAGEMTEAEAVWTKLASDSEDPSRIVSALDRLIAHNKNDTALAITERLLVKRPGDWEVLYREGVALDSLGKRPDAMKRFQAILDLKLEDESSILSRPKRSSPTAGPIQPSRSVDSSFPIVGRVGAASRIRETAKLEETSFAIQNGAPSTLWSPAEYGQARMAALGWLLSIARRENREDAWIDETHKNLLKSGSDPRALWDWYLLNAVRGDGSDIFQAAKELAQALKGDASADYAFLVSLANRAPAAEQGLNAPNEVEAPDRTPPLGREDLDFALAAFRNLARKKPGIASVDLMSILTTELKRAGKENEIEPIYREAIASASELAPLSAALMLAAERGTVDDFLAIRKKVENLTARQPVGLLTGGRDDRAIAFGIAMNQRAEAKSYGDVLALLDSYLTSMSGPDAVAARAQISSTSLAMAPPNYLVRVGKTSRYVNFDFPQPNSYFDADAIQVLRNAFELYKRDDLLSDLVAHLKKRCEQIVENERVYAILALGYLAWWDEEKDEAIEYFHRAVETAKGDVELRLGLAEILAARGEATDALELVDSVNPLDQKTFQRREIMALHLAVLSGNVERARKASERLFGLRLDTGTQMQLASQMNQLGMHELAETVLSRIRRKTGANLSTMMSLMVQYQQSGKEDQAFQIAGQILRTTANRQAATPNPGGNNANQDQAARSEAIALFARSGKLKELIDRAESQLAASPGSVQALQTLAEYYQADNQPEKVKEAFARLVKLRPDDLSLRFQVASQIFQSGDPAGALEHYLACFKKDPSGFLNRYYEIQDAFYQAGKIDELGKMFEDLDLKLFTTNPYVVQPLVSLLNQNPATRDSGMKLFRKFWVAFPEIRPNMLMLLDSEALTSSPEVYGYLREAVIPRTGKKKVARWAGFEMNQGWNGQGPIVVPAGRLLDAAMLQNRLDELAREVEDSANTHPDWAGGRALKGIIQVRRGKAGEARRTFEEIIASEKEISSFTRLFLGQEMENVRSLQDLVFKIYQGAEDDPATTANFLLSPISRLVTMLHEMGKDGQALALVLEYGKKRESRTSSDNGYQRLLDRNALAQKLTEIGQPAEALRYYQAILADKQDLESMAQFAGNREQGILQFERMMENTIMTLTEKHIVSAILALTPMPGAVAFQGKRVEKKVVPIELRLMIAPVELDQAKISSLYMELLRTIPEKNKIECQERLKHVLDERRAAEPNDLSGSITRCLLAIAQGDRDDLARTATQLNEIVERIPLEILPSDARPNARQRADALAQIPLWLVARELLKNEATRAMGELLQARSLEAARRQTENQWTLAILRECGQIAFDRGEVKAAEDLWRQMLDQILITPRPNRAKKAKLSFQGGVIATLIAVVQAPASQVTAPEIVSYTRFEQAIKVALMASDRKMYKISSDAVVGALGAGPPVVPIEIAANQNLPTIGQPNSSIVDSVASAIENEIHRLDESWLAHEMPPGLAYETLRNIVLPESPAGEIFLYLSPISQGDIDHPRSVSALLAKKAMEAGEGDDLRRRIEARLGQPAAEIPTRVLAVQLAIAMKDQNATTLSLQALADRVKGLPLTGLVEVICHAAIPALETKAAEPIALELIETATKVMGSGSGEGQEILGPLRISLARRQFKIGNVERANTYLLSYFKEMQTDAVRVNADYFLYWRKQLLANIAIEFARAGRLSETWDYLARIADSPSSKVYPVITDLTRALPLAVQLLQPLPAMERYDRLKTWSLPAKDRKAVRILTAVAPEDPAVPVAFGVMPHARLDGFTDTASLLIEAAREAGRLEELFVETHRASEAKAENADVLRALVSIALRKDAEASALILARIEELKGPAKTTGPNPNGANGQALEVDKFDYLLARSALSSRGLASVNETLARLLIEHANESQGKNYLTRLKRDLALHRAELAGKMTTSPGPDPGLSHWSPTSLQASVTHQLGSILPVWVESQGIVSQITGPQSQFLVMNYPITGKFEVSVDAYIGESFGGQLNYAGLIFSPVGGGTVFPVGHHETRPTSDHFVHINQYNQTTIQVEPGRLRVLVNGHLFHEEVTDSSTSPWLGFFSESDKQSAFRHLTISGSPHIPREVRLVQGDHLEGWACGFYNETQPPRRSLDQTEKTVASLLSTTDLGPNSGFTWTARNGTILGAKVDAVQGQVTPPSRIYYYRPIMEGESIRYEFFYEPGQIIVHPTLERLAFLLEPEGVKLHWMTDSQGTSDEQTESTGLAFDNVVEPVEYRRGTGRLPLKSGQWNQVMLHFGSGLITITLNGTRIYEYPLEVANQRIFGFFHDKIKTQAKIRNIILTGNWPETLPADLMARRDAHPSEEDRRARGAMIDDRFAFAAARSVLAESRRMNPEARLKTLTEFVLPDPDHSDFRMVGWLKPNQDDVRPEASKLIIQSLQAPALDLIEVASSLGRLVEFAKGIENTTQSKPDGARGRLSLAVMLDIARGRVGDARVSLEALQALVEKTSSDDKSSRWPELLAATTAMDQPMLKRQGQAILSLLDQQWKRKGDEEWGSIVAPIASRALRNQEKSMISEGWFSAVQASASSRGRGMMMPTWTMDSDTWTHHPGHRSDHLYLASPLQGNFALECELTSFGWREMHVEYAGISIEIEPDRRHYHVRDHGQIKSTSLIDPPLHEIGDWYAYKLRVADGLYQVEVNGRKIHEARLAEGDDPWLSLVCRGIATGSVRKLKISGTPRIPESLALTEGHSLNGWMAYDYEDYPLWSKQGDEILGVKLRDPMTQMNPQSIAYARVIESAPRGSKQESVLRYHRPMNEDGEIAYEFYYQPDQLMVHPALGRLVFLIEPTGVRLHQLTNAQFGPDEMKPDNATIETADRRGPAELPLISESWNRVQFRIRKNTINLLLNDVLILSKPLQAGQTRDFGLFHYADETEVRVRNVVYRGDWPKNPPR